jgi:2-dehydropantoate 2-reductase
VGRATLVYLYDILSLCQSGRASFGLTFRRRCHGLPVYENKPIIKLRTRNTIQGIQQKRCESGNAETNQPVDRRVYIVGLGNVGILIAHALAAIPRPPPITLLLHSEALKNAWAANGEKLEVRRNNIVEPITGFKVERNFEPEYLSRVEIAEHGHISNLIVSVKGVAATLRALSAVKHRLTPASTILLPQNGMGIVDEVNEKIFPDESARPCYLIGIVSHGVFSEARFRVRHVGVGTMAIGLPTTAPFEQLLPISARLTHMAPSTRYMLRTITRTSVLGAIGVAPFDLLQLQLERLAVNAILYPLTAIFQCNNGALLYNLAILRLTFMLLAEISLVLRSLPELKGLPNVEKRFSAESLRKRVIGIAISTSDNETSMLKDVEAGNNTEIDSITGYIIRRGEEVGIRCVVNYTILQMLKAKVTMVKQRERGFLPLGQAAASN